MWFFWILFLVSGLITIIGLILLIPKKTRKKGIKIASISFLICLISYGISPKVNYPNDEPGTITKAQYDQIKEGMSKDEITDILGEPDSKDDEINEWNYIGLDGDTASTSVSFHFNPEDKLELKLDGGLLPVAKDTTATSVPVEDTPITKQQYQQIEIGMTEDQVIEILQKSQDISNSDWYYTNLDSSFANITFDQKTAKVIKKSETGLLSDDSDTITDQDGTRENKPTNDEYAFDVQFDIQDSLGESVDWNGKTKDVVKEVKVNDNLGKNDGSKLILVHLNGPVLLTGSMTTEKVNEQTLKVAKALRDDESLDFKIDSIVYWWYLPLTDSYGKTKEKMAYKIELESSTLDKIDYDKLKDLDLSVVADQYNVLYNDQN